MPITVKLEDDGVHGTIEHSSDLRWREGEPVELREGGGQVELRFRGGRAHVTAPHFEDGPGGQRRATFDPVDRLEDEESSPSVTPPTPHPEEASS
ncbi:hypothetical protein [Deinococcus aluminii]|uniref:Uncharacterized protein n=1 Tax=Deinococcus aluminii TaxID=1656885 RepID=A0ABP9XH92_9DEIO